MELKKLAEARVRYNPLSKTPVNTRDLLFMELPQDNLKNIAQEDYINMINDLSEDDEVNQFLTNKYQDILTPPNTKD